MIWGVEEDGEGYLCVNKSVGQESRENLDALPPSQVHLILRVPSFLQSHLGADAAVSPSSPSILIIVRSAEGLQDWGEVVSRKGSEGGRTRAYLAGYLQQRLPKPG